MLLRAFAAFALVITLVTSLTSSAFAQDRTKEIAREKFEQGVAAYDTGDYEKARTLFLQAYALTRHPLVLLNLGQSELKAGKTEDGGNHLQQFLREHKDPTEQQKKDAQAGVADAQKKTGFVILIVDTNGAELAIDGTVIGASPLEDPHFVKPGKHVASAKKDGKTTKTEIDVKRGTATPVTLNLGGGGAVAPIPSPNPTPGPAPVPYPMQPNPVPGPYPVAPMPPPYGQPRPGGDTGREDLWPWFKRRPGAWVLFGVAGASLIGTVVFGAIAGAANSNASGFEADILDRVGRGQSGEIPAARLPPQFWSNGNGTGDPQPCGTFDDPNSSFGHYTDACNQLRDEIDTYDSMLIGVAVMVPVFVLSTTGLVVYYFLDSDDKGSGRTGSLMPVPIITPDTQGAGLVGTF